MRPRLFLFINLFYMSCRRERMETTEEEECVLDEDERP